MQLDTVEVCKLFNKFLSLHRAVGGELFDQLTRDVTFSEKRARFVWIQLIFFKRLFTSAISNAMCFVDFFNRKVMHEILTAVKYMHSKNIVHRDLKVYNTKY